MNEQEKKIAAGMLTVIEKLQEGGNMPREQIETYLTFLRAVELRVGIERMPHVQ